MSVQDRLHFLSTGKQTSLLSVWDGRPVSSLQKAPFRVILLKGMCCLFSIVCPLLWACRVNTETTSSFSTLVPTSHRKKLMNYGNFDQTTSLSSVIVSHLSLAICWADREIYTNATQMQTRKCKQKSSDEHQLGREMVKTAAPRKSGWHALPK